MSFSLRKLSPALPYVIIFILSILPVLYTWNRLPIWGDTIIPFNSSGLNNYLYQWNSLRGGMYFSLNYLPYLLFFKLLELITNNVYVISALLLFILKFVAGLGIYKLSRQIFKAESSHLYIFPIIFYLLSPSQLNASYYLYIYSFSPWLIYFVFKAISNQTTTIKDAIYISIILFFSSVNLPNPKYIFHLCVITIATASLGLFLKIIRLNFFTKNIRSLISIFLLSSFIIFPQLVFIKNYSPEKYDVHVKAGYVDQGVGIDFGESTLGRMWKLRKDSLNLNIQPKTFYTKNKVVNTLSYLFPAAIILYVFLIQGNTKNKKNTLILIVLTTIYLFFSAGHNPPFGFVYGYLIDTFPLLAFLRTTAGAVFFLSIFYSLLLFSIVVNQKTKWKQNIALIILILATSIVGYPILSGETYKNVEVIGQTDTSSRGFIIPEDYFEVKDFVDSFKFDSKIIYPGSDLSYISTGWGYFGVAIYDFLYNSDNIGCVDERMNTKNIGLVFLDKSLAEKNQCPIKTDNKNIIKKTNFLELYEQPIGSVVPHIHATNFTPIEYKKINPTKYIVKVHKATENFLLTFEENYSNKWFIYFRSPTANNSKEKDLGSYKVLTGNGHYQATKTEVSGYIKESLISDLGDLKPKTVLHKKNQGGQEAFDYKEEYNIDFISKEFMGSIQNNNLSDDYIWETWFKKPANLKNIKPKNNASNSWLFNIREICQLKSNCSKNADGSLEIELIVEFWPQRIAYLGYITSIITLISLLIYLFLQKVKTKDEK